jgi:DNA-binding SARP family transcriptional activator
MRHRYLLLGTLEVVGDDAAAAPDTPKVSAVLALLLLRANHVVTTSAISEELWGERVPKSASTTVQTYVYLLRRYFRSLGIPDEHSPLHTDGSGYVLRVGDDEMDVSAFEREARRGRLLADEGRWAEALDALTGAVSLWRGPALANVPAGPAVQAAVAHLDAALMRVRELQVQAQFMLGRSRDVIGELTLLAELHPLNEWVHERLVEALSRAGRRADALRALHRLRTNLGEQLGSVPSPSLHRLELDVLDARIPVSGFDGPSPSASAFDDRLSRSAS